MREGGTLILTFASHRPFLTERLYATLGQAFGVAPQAYRLDAANIAFIEGAGRNAAAIPEFQDISEELREREDTIRVATDHWPFLYLARPAIPKSILWVLVPFLLGAVILLHKTIGLPSFASRQAIHFFLLGAGFLLLETKGVTELSLLFGSTWIVNAVVIAAFLTMALLANTYVMLRPVSWKFAYTTLFVLLILGMMFPYVRLEAFPTIGRVLGAALLVGLPVLPGDDDGWRILAGVLHGPDLFAKLPRRARARSGSGSEPAGRGSRRNPGKHRNVSGHPNPGGFGHSPLWPLGPLPGGMIPFDRGKLEERGRASGCGVLPENKVGTTTTETGVRLYQAMEAGPGVSGSSARNVLVRRPAGLLAAGVFKWNRFLRTRGLISWFIKLSATVVRHGLRNACGTSFRKPAPLAEPGPAGLPCIFPGTLNPAQRGKPFRCKLHLLSVRLEDHMKASLLLSLALALAAVPAFAQVRPAGQG